MKVAFLVGSVINLSGGDFTYMEGRGVQRTDERARQTVSTLNSIFSKYPNAKVFLIEASLNLEESVIENSGIKFYVDNFNVELCYMSKIDPAVCITLNTHKNKTYCEALHIKTFIDHYEEQLKQYDLLVKLTGRYTLAYPCSTFELNCRDDVYFRRVFNFKNPNNEEWSYPDLMIPGQKSTDPLYTFAMTYAFGINRIDDFKNFLEFLMEKTENTGREIEMLIQYWSWKNNINHKEFDWKVYGYCGKDNSFVYR